MVSGLAVPVKVGGNAVDHLIVSRARTNQRRPAPRKTRIVSVSITVELVVRADPEVSPATCVKLVEQKLLEMYPRNLPAVTLETKGKPETTWVAAVDLEIDPLPTPEQQFDEAELMVLAALRDIPCRDVTNIVFRSAVSNQAPTLDLTSSNEGARDSSAEAPDSISTP